MTATTECVLKDGGGGLKDDDVRQPFSLHTHTHAQKLKRLPLAGHCSADPWKEQRRSGETDAASKRTGTMCLFLTLNFD